jgi:histidine triad (HIT) family protein
MASIFTRIIEGEIPCYKVAESEHYLAFLDINPLSEGHTLVVPKVEIDYVFDLDDITLAGLLVFAKPVAKAIQAVVPCERIGFSVIGLEVPHAHLHLLPINALSDMDFRKKRAEFTPQQFEATAAAIRDALEQMMEG